MHNITTRRTAGKSRDRFNANLLEQSLSSVIYNRWVSIWEFGTIGSPSTGSTTPDGNTPYTHDFTDSARNSVGAYVPKNREWRDGIVAIQPHFMMGATTGNAVLYCSLVALKNGDNLTAWPSTGTTYDKVIAAPAGAYDLYIPPESVYIGDSVWTVAVDDSTRAIQVCVGRNGADAGDTVTGDVHFLGAMLKYIEKEKSLGEAYDPIRR